MKYKLTLKRKQHRIRPKQQEQIIFVNRRQSLDNSQQPFLNNFFNKPVTKTKSRIIQPIKNTNNRDSHINDDVNSNKGQQLKVILHSDGIIECLDQGNFPHPLSCRKFISCAKFETGGVVGWEYTCPINLSYDPVGSMCNWSAVLDCI